MTIQDIQKTAVDAAAYIMTKFGMGLDQYSSAGYCIVFATQKLNYGYELKDSKDHIDMLKFELWEKECQKQLEYQKDRPNYNIIMAIHTEQHRLATEIEARKKIKD